MKPVLAFVITFVVGTAASTGAKVMMTKPAPAEADSTHADSTAAHDSTSKTDTAAVASGEPANPPSEAAHAPAAAAPVAAAPVAAAPVATAPVATTTPPATHAAAPAASNTKRGAPGKDSTKRAAGAAPAPSAPAQARSAASDSVIEASERRVAKVFTSMDAKQAAKVLEHMADSDVHIILGYVGPRQAASIMAALPPARVAKLSKMAMNGTTK